MLPLTLKGFSAFLDGRGYLGRVADGEAPKLTIKTEEHRDGGMDVPVDLDMGMEKLTSTITFDEYDPDVLATFGLLDGTVVPLVLKGSVEDEDGNASAVTHTMRGMCRELDPGNWQSGGTSKAQLKYQLSLRYYRMQVDSRVLHEIDPINVIRIVDGVDQLAGRRSRLGI